MRTRLFFVLLLFVLCIAIAAPALAASGTLLGGVSADCINNGNCVFCDLLSAASSIVSYLLLYVATPVIAGVFGWGGWLFITSGGNPGQREKGKSLAYKAITGFIIMLLGWFLVNSFISTLAGNQGWQWNVVTCDRPSFVNSVTQTALGGITGSGLTVGSGGGGITPGARGTAQCTDDNPNCAIPLLESHGLNATQANVMSCIAITENGGQAVGNSGTGPAGTFQITMTNWQIYAPAQCQASNFGGNINAAQNNGPCNLQTAAIMAQQVGYQPWTGTNPATGLPWNSAASTCVNNYGSGQNLNAGIFDALKNLF